MTSGAPWSVKGIDPKAREVAKDLARRSGMTLGEWLNRMILEEEGPEEITSQSYFTDPDYAPRIFSDRPEPARSYYETPRHEIFRTAEPQQRPEASHRPEVLNEPPSRYEAPVHPGDEIGRVTQALDRLTDRIETSEGRTGAAISGVEHSVREAIARIEDAERDHVSIAARFEGLAEEARAEQLRLTERVRRIEAEAAGPRSAEALRALEQALGRVANHLYEGENRTRQTLADLRERVEQAEAGKPGPSVEVIEEVVGRVGQRLTEAEARTAEALEGLRASFAGLDGRVGAVEASDKSVEIDHRFQQLSDHLKARFEATRGELVQVIEASSEGRFDRMERKLTEMAEQVRLAEQRSAQAIERVGQEVLTVADNLNRRVASSETRNADAIGQVSGEVARIANTVETRLSRADTVQAEAMEKLGAEIARISERLAERIANAERRSAQAFDEVGEQVARVTEKINQHGDSASDALVERIRQSEERTARLLDEAREKIDQRLSETQRRISEEMAAAPALRTLADPAQAFGEPEPFPDLPEPAGPPPPRSAAFSIGAAGAMTRTGFATPPPRAAAAAVSAPPALDILAAAALQPEDPFGETAEFEAAEPQAHAEGPFEAPAAEAPEPDFLSPESLIREGAARETAAPEAVAAPPSPFAAETFPAAPDQRAFDADDFEAADGFATFSAEEPQGELEPEDFAPELELAEEAHPPEARPEAPAFRAADEPAPEPASSAFDAAFAPEEEPHAHEPEHEHEEEARHDQAAFGAFDEPEPQPVGPLTTREVIEQARAAARASVQGDGRIRKQKPEKPAGGGGSLFGSMFGGRAKRRVGGSLQTALFVTGATAVVGLGAAGLVLMNGKPGGPQPQRVAEALAAFASNKHEIKGAEADTTPFPSTPRVAMAITPQPIGTATSGLAPAAPDLSDRFAKAAQDVDQKKPGAIDELKAVAELGHAPAQFYLARLYEKGEGGLKADPAQARRWTERAAEAGDRRAMHNLGMAYIYGSGGTKNSTTAAQWFRRAAELGLVDSQFNLAALYEKGLGVSQNPAEAYKWYLIAAKTGDGDARKRADQVKATLTPDARVVAEQAAAAFRVATPNASAPVAMADLGAGPAGVMVAQKALSRLGYYLGPTDGSPSPALKLAVAAYQRDHNTPATGALDPTTLQGLSVYTR